MLIRKSSTVFSTYMQHYLNHKLIAHLNLSMTHSFWFKDVTKNKGAIHKFLLSKGQTLSDYNRIVFNWFAGYIPISNFKARNNICIVILYCHSSKFQSLKSIFKVVWNKYMMIIQLKRHHSHVRQNLYSQDWKKNNNANYVIFWMRLLMDNDIFADLLKQLSTFIGITFVVA